MTRVSDERLERLAKVAVLWVEADGTEKGLLVGRLAHELKIMRKEMEAKRGLEKEIVDLACQVVERDNENTRLRGALGEIARGDSNPILSPEARIACDAIKPS